MARQQNPIWTLPSKNSRLDKRARKVKILCGFAHNSAFAGGRRFKVPFNDKRYIAQFDDRRRKTPFDDKRRIDIQ
jgi:hypothetical protein